MSQRKFRFAKLVRDKIVEGIKEAGNEPVYHKLSSREFVIELKKKIVEESAEIPVVKDKNELLKEIADLQEVIDNLVLALGSTKKEITKLQKLKNAKAGSFIKKLYIDYVITKEGSEWVKYYLASPEKYPEIKK